MSSRSTGSAGEMMAAPLIVDGVALPCRPKSDAVEQWARREEDLVFGARDTLEDIRRQYGTAAMMQYLPAVAKHFGFHRNDVLREWVKHYGPTLVIDAIRKVRETETDPQVT